MINSRKASNINIYGFRNYLRKVMALTYPDGGVRYTMLDSNNTSLKKGQEYIVEDLCPPLCHELWNCIYPLVYALLNGAELDYGNVRAKMFDAKCPDESRVCIHGEIMED